MTNHWSDIGNSDCVFIIGGNPAENHPAGFGWVQAAKDRGAKVICVDPRFTRSASRADIYAPIRSGTDIAFIGGMIKYVLDDMELYPENYNLVYVTEYTNASFLINPDFKGAPNLDGLFSGYDSAKRSYDKSTWQYQLDDNGIPKKDKSLKDPNCVFQLLKKHFARYTPEKVSQTTGTPVDTFMEVCRTYAATGKTGKAGTIMYAMGTTQHTNGTQMIRSYSILQLLLSNIGVCGGGIQAMRGEANVQGSTDHAVLWDILPGYLKVFTAADTSLAKYLERVTPQTKDPVSANWLQNYPKYLVSLLKAWYGDAATKDNDFGYAYLPRVSKGVAFPGNAGNYSWLSLFEAMYAGTIKGLMVWGQNPAVCGPNVNMERKALDKLDWLVAADLWETETAAFWKRPGANPADIKTEVFLLPAALSYEKEGSVTNSGRWAQWRYKAVNPPGDAEHDLGTINKLMVKLRQLYAAEGGPNAEAITRLTWNYGDDPNPHQVAKEINGYDLTTGKLMASYAALRDNGTTTCGNWIYSASYTEAGNMMARRDLSDPMGVKMYPSWAWCWPVNRRIIYNRASVDLNGIPWDKEHPVIWWKDGKWVGDIADGGYPPMAVDPVNTRYPFIMLPDGYAHLFGPYMGSWWLGLADGPFPEHYEPWESPLKNPLSGTQNDPAFKIWASEMDKKGEPDRYPIVATTYRISEQWQAGQMTRNLPWLVELQPEMFVEMSEELAAEKGIKNGEKCTVETARGSLTAVTLVTKRFRPFHLNGKVVHQIGMPWHWGYTGLSTGDSANMLTPHVGDANTMIPEYKAFLCNVRKA